MGVSGAACVGCLGCYWVKETGDSRVPLPAAQRTISSLHKGQVLRATAASMVRAGGSSYRLQSRFQEGADVQLAGSSFLLQVGSGSLGSSTGAVFFLDFQRPYSQPYWKGVPRPGMTQAMSFRPGRAGSSPAQETSEPTEAYPGQEGAPASPREQM